jgi:hypothetical protein
MRQPPVKKTVVLGIIIRKQDPQREEPPWGADPRGEEPPWGAQACHALHLLMFHVPNDQGKKTSIPRIRNSDKPVTAKCQGERNVAWHITFMSWRRTPRRSNPNPGGWQIASLHSQ